MPNSVLLMSIRVLMFGLAMTVVSAAWAAPGDEWWEDDFYTKSLSQWAGSVAMGQGGEIFVGGSFKTADDVVVNNIARWDGARWNAMGNGLHGSVRALVVDSSGNLYAGGYFEDAGGDPDADHVAVWDGSSWSSLGGAGSGLDSSVNTLAFDPNGDLVAGGGFEDAGGDPDADHIAVWDGSNWSSIGGAGSGVDNKVLAIEYSPSGKLVIGGAFVNAGGVVEADYIASWNGSSWEALGGGLSSWVYALTYAANGDLYVGGSFTNAGGDSDADRIAVWNSPTWRSVDGAGSGLSNTVRSIEFTSSGRLFIAGSFTNAGGDPDADRAARWSSTLGWISMDGPGTGLDHDVECLILDDGNLPVVVGQFNNAGGHEAADFVARWDSGNWVPLSWNALPAGSGLDDYVYAVEVDDRGRFYAGGSFEDAGDDPDADRIAVWDGTGWSAMGPEGSVDGDVYAIAAAAGGNVVVGGDFYNAGGDQDADYIAAWDGVAWGSLGGPGSGLDSYVHALVATDDGRIIAGGDFSDAGGDPDADNVAVWDGVNWSALVGPGGGIDSAVYELFVDGAGDLYAGGVFDDAGGDPDADGVAKWDGTAWTSVGGPGSGIEYAVHGVVVDDLGRVFAGGDFTDLGGDPDADHVVVWDGMSWAPLGAGLNNLVRDLAIDGVGNVYAAGDFESEDVDPLHPDHIAMWDGIAWNPLGGGLDSYANAMAYDGGFDLVVGGEFYVAGDVPSVQVGIYRGAVPAGLLFADRFESGDTSAWSR